MVKLILLLSLLLSGCVSTKINIPETKQISNPYEKMSFKQLSNIDSESLCDSTNSLKYKLISPDSNLSKELLKRGYKDCSEDEIYCLYKLNLKPGTQLYASCRLQRDQYNLQVDQAARDALYKDELLAQASKPTRIYVHQNIHHSYY